MYLKKIEMQGFKSFANKMVFEFHQGITGIVGPNGSGKSNVADAVRWVLGEQSARQLRGGNMQDVIFAGTAARKPQSFASVAITFDNEDRALDVDYAEVTVTRRLFRSGESEYLINNVPSRLRDIQELFYDTGIGKEGYSIIGQGQIERIVSGKPEERRELFDEAAGIVKFKRRKTASLKKLAEEQQNLLRVSDILSELTGQLAPLKKQSESAKIYLERRDRLKNCDINLYLIEEQSSGGQLKELSGKAEIADASIAETKEELEKVRAEYDALEKEIGGIEEESGRLAESISGNSLIREQLKGQIELLREQINTTRQMSGQYQARKEAIRKELAQREEERQRIREDSEKISGEIAKARAEQKKLGDEMELLDQEIAKTSESVGRARNEVIGLLNSRSSYKGRTQRYDAMLEQIDIRKAELSGRLLRFEEEEHGARERMEESDRNLAEIRERTAALRRENENLSARAEACQDEIRRMNEELENEQTEYHREASRLESLKAITESYEGYSNGIRRIMEQKSRNPGILGVVADLISTEERYETAIETALGGSLRNIVTDNETTAKYLIEFLKRNRFGRATFLPLTNIRARKRFEPQGALREEGVIGLASELVSAEERYEALVSHLLGRTLVVDTIDNAIRIGRRYAHSLFMVTLGGESFSPGGSITGGALRNQENLLGRTREIDELTRGVRQLKKTIADKQEAISKKRKERDSLREEIVSLSGKLHAESIRENTEELSKKQAEDALLLGRVDRQALVRESTEIEKQIEKVKASRGEIEKELEGSEESERSLNERIRELEAHFQAVSEERHKKAAETEEIRIRIQGMQQNSGFLFTNQERLSREVENLREEDAGIDASLLAGESEAGRKKNDIASIEETIREGEKQSALENARLSELNARKASLAGKNKGLLRKREDISENLSALDKESFRLHAQKEKIEESMASQAAYLWEEYELTPSEARKQRDEELTDRRELKREIGRLKEEIRKLGNVNVNAIEDYKNLLERHSFLDAQHKDLVESEKTLMGIIDELDRGMRKQFSEKFAEISREFDRTFRQLFGGGVGTLKIDESADILEAAITIDAEPPGKKLQNMMQLSGGEKALTAIALLFAIQSLKPSPFCLLDEIEAALDDNNVGRFAEYLHKLTANTQFIVITHRRGTMASADRLYGITMQEKGISTLVSVNLIEETLDA
ncbi:MAG: chromosome segregation protein SMC [Lachnospiraceae bacterium]|nr:chromosome segregation protein SMC [Lachnospiraceae bacterium]